MMMAVLIWTVCIVVGAGLWGATTEDPAPPTVPPLSHDDSVSQRNYREGETARVTLLRADSEYLESRWERHGWPLAKAEAETRNRMIRPLEVA